MNLKSNNFALASFNLAFDRQDFNAVIRFAPSILSKSPRNISVLHRYALALIHVNDKVKAKEVLEKLVKIKSDELLPMLHLARVYQDLGEIFAAKWQFELVIKKFPESMDAYASYGVLLQANGCAEGAKQIYEKALSIDPGSFVNAYNLAGLLNAEGEKDAAFDIYHRFWLASKNHIAGMELAKLFVSYKKDYQSAYSIYDFFMKSGHNRIPVMVAMADAMQQEGRNSEAERYYRGALLLSPKNPQICLKLSDLLRLNGQNDEAVELIDKIDLSFSESIVANLNLAQGLGKSGCWHKSLSLIKKITSHSQAPAEAYFMLANALWKVRDFDGAQRAYQQGFERDPTSMIGWSNFFYLQSTVEDLCAVDYKREVINYGLRMSVY